MSEDSTKYSICDCYYNESDSALQKIPDVDISNPAKKDYTDMAGALIALSTFAGGLTIATQFIAQCPGTRVEALLAMASQLFLGTPLCLMTVYLYLYGVNDDIKVSYRSSLHAFIVVQFTISGLLLSTAFVLLGTAILAAEVDDKVIGAFGLVLLGLFLVIGVVAGFIKSGFWRFRPGGPNSTVWPSVWRAGPLLIVQVVVFGLLIGCGSRSASQALIQNGCISGANSTA
jgi:hypothetical protein